MGFSYPLDLRQLHVALLQLAALISIGGGADPQEPLCSWDDTCAGTTSVPHGILGRPGILTVLTASTLTSKIQENATPSDSKVGPCLKS